MLKIINLRNEPENLLTLASWHQDEWSYLNPGEDLVARISRMQSFLNEDFIRSTFIARDEVLLGSAAIVLQDMKTEPQLTPWLASVFIRPEARRQGVGRQLVLHVMEQARKEGIDCLYLYTPDQESFYIKLGWSTIDKLKHQGHDVTIMQVKLNV
jgi:N-acetylglutamate synthase-like GNAT family acetyltransferase